MVKDLAQARADLSELCADDGGLVAHCFPLRRDDEPLLVVAVKDVDEERNLGDYQNVTYFVLSDGPRAVVIDPGIREAEPLKAALGIAECDVVFTHYHLDHWIGYEPYVEGKLHASETCRTVLARLVGIEHTGKSIFFEGRLTDHHRRPTPTRAVNDAERLLPVRAPITKVSMEEPFERSDLGLTFVELPYGQTEGSLYGVLTHDDGRLLFAGDLFADIGDRLRIEPHYAFKSPELVVDEVIVMLRALLGEPIDPPPDDPAVSAGLEAVKRPTEIALGHGLLKFADMEDDVAHLRHELEELRRIEKEHII
jgi:glyoxylase-like metal-dependent hydrolase (beta-lactamase superfamily II)